MDVSAAIDVLEKALSDGKICSSAVENIKDWLNKPSYGEYVPQIVEHIQKGLWKELDDSFWTVIPFGTGGRRGKMYPIGSNAINDRTIGESAQGLATYVKEVLGDEGLSVALAYDTRHRSREFAELCASIMVANGFKVYFLNGVRSTPELSYAVRAKKCSCGIMVTASHNPPSDNAVKVYWSTGGQLLPPHDAEVIKRVMSTGEIKVGYFKQSLRDGQVVYCEPEIDAAYIAEVKGQTIAGPRDLKVIYSPLHGVGSGTILPVLEQVGFTDVEEFGPHAEPSGDFPNVPGNISNPENTAVFDIIIERAQEVGADLILATDPDADRLGAAAPVTNNPAGEWASFTGNQIGALICEYLLEKRRDAGALNERSYIVKTLVTTEMIRRIADSFGVKTKGNLHVGFKWIAGQMDEFGPSDFVFGTEESHGYLVGSYARDKDAVVASMLLSELAASVKAEGQSLHEKLESLYWQYGYHLEKTISLMLPGSDGMERTKKLMEVMRQSPPESLAGMKVSHVRDYLNLVQGPPGAVNEALDAPDGNLVILDLESEGNYIAVRPSGTEPKVKFYMFTYQPAEMLHNLAMVRADLESRVAAFEEDLRAFEKQI